MKSIPHLFAAAALCGIAFTPVQAAINYTPLRYYYSFDVIYRGGPALGSEAPAQVVSPGADGVTKTAAEIDNSPGDLRVASSYRSSDTSGAKFGKALSGVSDTASEVGFYSRTEPRFAPGTGDWSITFWSKRDPSALNYPILLSNGAWPKREIASNTSVITREEIESATIAGSDDWKQGWGLFLIADEGNNRKVAFRCFVRGNISSAYTIVSTGTINTTTQTGYHHFAVTRAGDTLTLYVDGVAEGTTTLPAADADIAAPTVSGAAQNNFRNTVKGMTNNNSFTLDELAFWSAALTAGQVAAIAQGTEPIRTLYGKLFETTYTRQANGNWSDALWAQGDQTDQLWQDATQEQFTTAQINTASVTALAVDIPVEAAKVSVSGSQALALSGSAVLTTPVLDLSAFASTLTLTAPWSGIGSTTLGGSAILALSTATDSTFPVPTGSGRLNKSGAGTLTLTGDIATHTGTIMVSGSLAYAVPEGETKTYAGDIDGGSFAGSFFKKQGPGTLQLNAVNGGLCSLLVEQGTLVITQNGQWYDDTGANSRAEDVVVSQGATLAVYKDWEQGTGKALGNISNAPGGIHVNGGRILIGANTTGNRSFTFANGTTLEIAQGVTYTKNASQLITPKTANATLTLAGQGTGILNQPNPNTANGNSMAIAITGANWSLNGAYTYTGATTVATGATLRGTGSFSASPVWVSGSIATTLTVKNLALKSGSTLLVENGAALNVTGEASTEPGIIIQLPAPPATDDPIVVMPLPAGKTIDTSHFTLAEFEGSFRYSILQSGSNLVVEKRTGILISIY